MRKCGSQITSPAGSRAEVRNGLSDSYDVSGAAPIAVRRVLVVEDHPVFREGLVQMLVGEPDLAVVGACGCAESGLAEFRALHPDLLLIDLSLPGHSGLDLIRQVRAISHDVKMLVVSMHDEAVYAERVLSAGANGYIMKDEDFSEILNAVHDVLAGHLYLSEAVLTRSRRGLISDRRQQRPESVEQLSDAELEILELLGAGKSNVEIARRLKWSIRNVAGSCRHMRRTLNLNSNNQLIRYAVCWLEHGGQ